MRWDQLLPIGHPSSTAGRVGNSSSWIFYGNSDALVISPGVIPPDMRWCIHQRGEHLYGGTQHYWLVLMRKIRTILLQNKSVSGLHSNARDNPLILIPSHSLSPPSPKHRYSWNYSGGTYWFTEWIAWIELKMFSLMSCFRVPLAFRISTKYCEKTREQRERRWQISSVSVLIIWNGAIMMSGIDLG